MCKRYQKEKAPLFFFPSPDEEEKEKKKPSSIAYIAGAARSPSNKTHERPGGCPDVETDFLGGGQQGGVCGKAERPFSVSKLHGVRGGSLLSPLTL
jgi:hypothetical protein